MSLALERLTKILFQRRSIPSQVWKKLLLIASGIAAGVLIAELIARIFALGPPVFQPTRLEASQSPYIWDTEGFLRYRPNNTFAHVYDVAGDKRGYFGKDGRITYRINNLGFRGADVTPQKGAGVTRIVFLGDSYTVGEGVREPDIFVERLKGLLTDKSQVEIINAAVSTWGTVEQVKVFKRECLSLQPDIVVLAFVMNDALSLAQQSDIAGFAGHHPRHFLRVAEIYAQTVQTWRTHHLSLAMTNESFQSPLWEECKTSLREMVRLSDEHKFRFVVAIFPVMWSLDETHPFKQLHREVRVACEQAGAEVLDLLDTYMGYETATLWVHPLDRHPNELGHKIAAEAIADFIRRPGLANQ